MTYRSVESKIRDVLEGLQPKSQLGKESDQNDQIAVGSYTTKVFDMSPDAQIIFADLPKETDANSAEQTAIHLDRLFDLHKNIIASQEASQADIDKAEELVGKIKPLADAMGQAEKIDKIANDHYNDLKKYFKDETKEVDPDYHPADDPRFHSPPSGNKPDPIAGPQGDRDVDNVKNYLIKRSKAAQRKLKLIDND
jgi:hypothetical protein